MALGQLAKEIILLKTPVSRNFRTLYRKRNEPKIYLFLKHRRTSSSSLDHSQRQTKHNATTKIRRPRSFLKAKYKWYFYPFGVGVCLFGLSQMWRNDERKKRIDDCEFQNSSGTLNVRDQESIQSKRAKVRPDGPWQVQVMSTLPLKAISRLWGRFNELEIPYYLRVPGFKLYSYIFGVNLSEISEPNLHAYPNLASFFYRTLKPGLRPLDSNPNALLSPADGRVLQFGLIEDGDVEQVKGVTYSLDALLGGTTKKTARTKHSELSDSISSNPKKSEAFKFDLEADQNVIKQDEEFARLNGISYTLSSLFKGPENQLKKNVEDASTIPKAASEAEVRADLALGETSWYSKLMSRNRSNPTALYYIVVYLAPGDYHRFHSPCAWVVETRRHFAGELYSVSPYLQSILPGLFTLNERVVLLGRWRWGFFSYIPVGATNVGSIKVNFDRELQTNSLVTDTAADLEADEAAKRGEPYCGYSEATYEAASLILGGHSLRRGEEMGGFQLGSTIVLVFEAPKGQRPSLDEGWMGEKSKRVGGWKWAVERGQKIKMGQALGWVDQF
ncbi:Phosphatidylserine decarboxylase proenzyme 1, mitochondrial [Golovinomyces cichoracearum]|uniref:Phosphatidylserine decarboxylase proenzyme 1, mitochondrial n=1 Tax=Golovinomyces cichoracearum TaxID=62708 RepID=A0A420J9D4_9PEZI|nr:Phosphatidylserine decarboxylase proenzyme 1, mitochondrial [Golovinomyces cichoracearum]